MKFTVFSRKKIPHKVGGFSRVIRLKIKLRFEKLRKKKFEESIVRIIKEKMLMRKEEIKKMIKIIKENIMPKKMINTKNILVSFFIFSFSFSFLYNPNQVLAVAPTVNITYSSNPVKAGTQRISVTYSSQPASTPTIGINQLGTTDIPNGTAMVPPYSDINAPGVTWSNPLSSNIGSAGGYWNSIAYGNDIFVAVSNYGSGNKVATSSDYGVTWIPRTPAESNNWESVTFGNGIFVAVSSNGNHRVMTSDNGINWFPQNVTEDYDWQSVTYDNDHGVFVAVADSGTHRAMTSSDGIIWEYKTTGSYSWNSVAYGNGVFVAVGNLGKIQKSTNSGDTWNDPQINSNSAYLYSVAYGNGVFVAVGASGTIRTSSDFGDTWQEQTSGTGLTISDVTFGNNTFVAVTNSSANLFLTSPDGLHWTSRTATAGATSIAYGTPTISGVETSMFVAVERTSSLGTNLITSTSRKLSFDAAHTYYYDYTVCAAGNSGTGACEGNYVDGTATVTLSDVKDLYGVSYTPSGTTFTIDTTESAPGTPDMTAGTDTGSSSTDNTTSDTTPDFTISCDTGATVTLYKDTTSSVGTGTCSSSTVTITSSTLSAGTYAMNAKQTDAAGNTSSASGNLSVTIDTTAPSVSTVTYSRSSIKQNDTLTITVNFNEALAITNPPQIAISGVNNLTATNMTEGYETCDRHPCAQVLSPSRWTYDFSIQSGNGSPTVTISAGQDAAGNIMTNASSPTSFSSFTVDNIAPTNQNTVFPTSISKKSSVTVTSPNIVSAGETGGSIWFAPSGTTTFTAGATMTTAGGTATTILAPLTAGSYKLFVRDAAGNTSLASTAILTVDNTAPTVALSYTSDPIKAGTQTITATYSKAITSIPNIRVDQYGTVPDDLLFHPMTNNDSGVNKVWKYDYTVHAATDSCPQGGTPPCYADGTAQVSLSSTTDVAGNTSGTPSSSTFIIDTAAPTNSISAPSVSSTSIGPVTYTVSYSGANTVSLANENITLIKTGTADGTVAVSGTGISSRTVTISSITGTGTLGISIAAGTASDTAGNTSLAMGASTTFDVSNVPLTVASISVDLASGSYKSGQAIITTVTFSKDVTSTGNATVTFDTGGTCTFTISNASSGSCTYTVGAGQNSSVLAVSSVTGTIKDAALNLLTATTPVMNISPTKTIVIDTTAPILSFTDDVAVGPTSSDTITASWVGTTTGQKKWMYDTDRICSPTSTDYTMTDSDSMDQITTTNNTKFICLYGADLAGNYSTLASTNDINIDASGPTVSISSPTSSPTNETITVNVLFDKSVSDFIYSDISVTNGTVSSASFSGSGMTYSFIVTPTANGVVGISIGSGVAHDTAGNTNSASNSISITYSNIGPTVILSSPSPYYINGSFDVVATFSEPVTGFTSADITINGGIGNSYVDGWADDGTTYEFSIVPDGGGIVTVDINGGVAVNAAQNGNIAATQLSRLNDTAPPTAYDIPTICSVEGNLCTTAGQNADPQEVYDVGMSTISSTAEDGDSGISNVQISINDTTANKWYNGTIFTTSGSEILLNTVFAYSENDGQTHWSYDFSSVPLITGDTYTIKVTVTDGVSNTNTASESFKFINSAPEVSNVVPLEDATGLVTVHYDVTDNESSQTTNYLFYSVGGNGVDAGLASDATSLNLSDATYFPNSGIILIDNEMISYTSKSGATLLGLTRGILNTIPVAHEDSATVYIKASSATGGGIGLSDVGTNKTITWQASSDANGYEYDVSFIKVVANDGGVANMVGSATNEEGFILDAKAPTATVTFDAGVGGETNSGVITIPMPEDISAVEYKITDVNNLSTNADSGVWKSITTSTTLPWTFDSNIIARSLKYQFRDAYGNIGSEITTSTQDPIPTKLFTVTDTSNVSSTPAYHQMHMDWQAVSSSGFSSYKLEYKTSRNNINYIGNGYTSISSTALNNVSTDSYDDKSLTPDNFYKYRIGIIGTNGNVSMRSDTILVRANGFQDYDEGGGGTVLKAPKVENVVPIQGSDKNVTVNYLLTDTSLSKKIDLFYEGYLFYNIGITLPEDSFSESEDTLTLSDTSKLKSSGYILVNNEVIKYTSISGNVLEGLTRGTWPNLSTSGRTTRTNSTFSTGAPVWIFANNTIPIAINSNSSIISGEAESIVWNTEDETGLKGNVFSKVEFKVLIHDNQTSSLGPISSQNDSSQDGILSILDLSDTVIEPTVKSTSAVITWNTDDYSDSLIEYGTTEGVYNLSKSNSDRVTSHRIYLSNLLPSTTYFYKTTSTNELSEAITSTGQFTTSPSPVVTSVSVQSVTDTTAVITWTTADVVSSSYVVYSTNSDLSGSITVNDDELVTDHTVTLSGLTPERNYYFKVYSVDANEYIGEKTDNPDPDTSTEEIYFMFTTGLDETAPIISNIQIPIITYSGVAIIWTTNEQADGRIGYSTESVEDGGSYTYTDVVPLSGALVTNHVATIEDLRKTTKYYYVVESTDTQGNTATSDEGNFTTDRQLTTGGGNVIGVLQEIYDALMKENEENKARLKNQSSDIPVISNVDIVDVNAFGATISFNTDKETVGGVDYGKDTKYGKNEGDFIWSTTHKIVLNGLTMGTDYNFKIKVIDRYSNIGTGDNQTFKTKFLTEKLAELQKIENIEQFQKEIEATIESILPSLVPPFIDLPAITNITENTATITFKTNIKTYPVVNYSSDATYDITKENPYEGEITDTTEKSLDHTLSLIGLKPNTKYHVMAKAYSLPQVIGKSVDVTFTTKPSKIKATITERKNDSFTIVWVTDGPTSSIVEYKDLKTNKTGRISDDAKNTSHSVKIENLTPGTSYTVDVSGYNDIGNLVEGSETLTVNTLTDTVPPVISNFKLDSALVLGRTDKTQTIVSWTTDEPSTSIVYYEEGSGSPDKALANKQENSELSINHVIILTTLRPGTVYRFQIASRDNANNINTLPIRTIITPRPNESIVDIIFKNFDETFNFLKNVQ
ncbi:MAG: fibronectin type III domain-containing protein [Candidatus Paceibacterota bacterium]